MKSIFVLGLLAAALLVSAASNAKAQTTSAAQQPAAAPQNSGDTAPITAPQNSSNTAAGSQNPAYNAPPAWQNGTPSEGATNIDPRTGAGAGQPNEGGIIRLSGCLERGSGPDEYSLTGRGGNWWELKSTSIDLGAYLDLTVMIAALPTPNPDGTLNVTALAMVQNSCTY